MNLLTLSLVILLPVVPAYLLFKILPSSAQVTGPFQGLTLKLGGAFAGYFAVLLLIILNLSNLLPPPVYQVWQVEGNVTDDKQSALERLDETNFHLSPPHFTDKGGGSFTLTFTTSSTPAGNGIDFPTLTVAHDQFKPLAIPLDPAELAQRNDLGMKPTDIDSNHRRIILRHIALQPLSLPSYSPAGAPPVPAATEPGTH